MSQYNHDTPQRKINRAKYIAQEVSWLTYGKAWISVMADLWTQPESAMILLVKTYYVACARDGSTMVPFAMETYGARGKQAQQLLLKLADASEELSAAAFLLHASAALSVALQCGNANIAARGTQSLRMRQAAASSLHASHSARHEPAGRRHRKQPLQAAGEHDDDDRWQVGSAVHAQMQEALAEPRGSLVAA